MTLKLLSPSERIRLEQWFDGPREGEDENHWLARMNGILTESDRKWIVEFMDDYNKRRVTGS